MQDVNFGISAVALVLLILLVQQQIAVWRWRCLISPAFYFGVVWSLGVIGNMVFDSAGLLVKLHPEYINELNGFVAFTAFCFLLFTRVGARGVRRDAIVQIHFIRKYSLFNLLSLLLLAVAVATFVKAGASLDMGQSREDMHDNVENQSAIVGYVQTVATPLSIFAGSVCAGLMAGRLRLSVPQKLLTFTPLLANLFFSLYLGGRVNFVYGAIDYLVGFCLAMQIKENARVSGKVIRWAVAGFLVLNIFITAVAWQREQHYGNAHYERVVRDNVALAVAYGPIEYVNSTYIGYQCRRVDAVDLDHLGCGMYTFNGFINWTIPFSDKLGIKDVSIAKVLDAEYDSQETYDFERVYYYMTHSCYIPLVKDFGVYWIYVVIFLLTLLSHLLFVNVQSYRVINRCVGLFFYYLFFNFWLRSNYYGTLSNSILVAMYGFLIIDILSVNYVRQRRNKRHSKKRLKPKQPKQPKQNENGDIPPVEHEQRRGGAAGVLPDSPA